MQYVFVTPQHSTMRNVVQYLSKHSALLKLVIGFKLRATIIFNEPLLFMFQIVFTLAKTLALTLIATVADRFITQT